MNLFLKSSVSLAYGGELFRFPLFAWGFLLGSLFVWFQCNRFSTPSVGDDSQYCLSRKRGFRFSLFAFRFSP